MPAHRTPRWTTAELAELRQLYPTGGIGAVQAALPARSVHAIHVQAHRLGLKCLKPTTAPQAKLAGDALEQAIVLREEQGWSFARIGAHFGLSEAAACNAVTTALCTRRGYTPAERDCAGRLTEEGRARLRLALKKGLKGADIQLRLGLSAGRVAEERRRYNRELKARGLALLPPPGGGAAYSGVKLTRAAKAEVEALFMAGLGTLKIHQRTGVSKTSCTRIRSRLVKRLRRQGQSLPGCDATGARGAPTQSFAFIHPAQQAELLALLCAGVPVLRAARHCAIGQSKAYVLRDQLVIDLAAKGQQLPAPVRAGRVRTGAFRESHWPPAGPAGIYAFRAMLARMGPDADFAAAKDQWRRDRAAEDQAAKLAAQSVRRSFDEQLAMVASGQLGLTGAFNPRSVAPRLPTELRPPA